jgi:hypothetical protein
MSTDVNLSKDDRQTILECLIYWIENIPQDETNKEDFLHAVKLRKKFKKLCPWIP